MTTLMMYLQYAYGTKTCSSTNDLIYSVSDNLTQKEVNHVRNIYLDKQTKQ